MRMSGQYTNWKKWVARGAVALVVLMPCTIAAQERGGESEQERAERERRAREERVTSETGGEVAVDSAAAAARAAARGASPATLAPVRTTARRDRTETLLQPRPGVTRMAGDALKAVPALVERDVLRAVQLLPGVSSANDFAAGFSVRGGKADENLVLLDGHPLHNPFHLGGAFATFPEAAVRGVDAQLGVAEARFGGRLSSVMDVESATMGDGPATQANISLLAATASSGGRLPGGGAWRLTGRRTYVDLLTAAVTPTSFPYHFHDVQLAGRVPLAGGTLQLTGYTGRDQLAARGGTLGIVGDEGSFDLGWGNMLAGAKWTRLVGGRALFTQRASASRFDATMAMNADASRFDNRLRELRLSGDLTWAAGSHERAAGYEVAHVTTRHALGVGERGFDYVDATRSLVPAALWVDDRWSPTARLDLRTGLRLEHVAAAGWTGFSPRLAARFTAGERTVLTAAAGRHAQWLHSVQDGEAMVRLFDVWMAADRRIPVATAWQGTLGLEQRLGDRVTLQLEGWAKRYDGLAEWPGLQALDDASARVDTAHGWSAGSDLLLRWEGGQAGKWRGWSGWASWGLAWSVRETGGLRYAPPQDRRHVVNALVRQEVGRLQWSARWSLATGAPYTPVSAQYARRAYDPGRGTLVYDVGRFEYQAVAGVRGSARFPVYHRLDLSAQLRFSAGRVNYLPTLSIINAYARRNVLGYSWDYTTLPATRTALSQLPFVPSVGLTVEW